MQTPYRKMRNRTGTSGYCKAKALTTFSPCPSECACIVKSFTSMQKYWGALRKCRTNKYLWFGTEFWCFVFFPTVIVNKLQQRGS